MNHMQRKNAATFARCQARYDAMEPPEYWREEEEEEEGDDLPVELGGTDVSEVLELQDFRISATRIAKQRGNCDGVECVDCPLHRECADISTDSTRRKDEAYLNLAIAYLGE